jgi:RDD family
MAVYDPPQSLWKRNTAGILDFILAATVFGLLLYKFFPGNAEQMRAWNPGVNEVNGLGPWASLTLLALVIAYFVVLGRTGGTVFQRLFGMKRAK